MAVQVMVGVGIGLSSSTSRQTHRRRRKGMTTSILKLPTPSHQLTSPKLQPSQHHTHTLTHTKSKFTLHPLYASSTSSNTDTPPAIDDSLPPGACKGCGKLEMERNCNGEGRIQGGIATVPGFGWWPIKAYRPCPGFVASGGRYRRQGQSMDDMSGLGRERRAPKATTIKPQSSKNKTGTKKAKS